MLLIFAVQTAMQGTMAGKEAQGPIVREMGGKAHEAMAHITMFSVVRDHVDKAHEAIAYEAEIHENIMLAGHLLEHQMLDQLVLLQSKMGQLSVIVVEVLIIGLAHVEQHNKP